MQPIRTKEEFNCDKCSREAKVSIEFESHTYSLCEIHEEEFKEHIKDKHL